MVILQGPREDKAEYSARLVSLDGGHDATVLVACSVMRGCEYQIAEAKGDEAGVF
jgi:hypothetical protein